MGIPFQALPAFDTFVGKPDLNSYHLYVEEGYSTLHNWLANFVLRKLHASEIGEDQYVPTISHLSIPISSNTYVTDPFSQILNLLAFFMFLIFIVPLYRIVYRIVNEKETRARESMKMMGLTDSSYWLSWLTYYMFVIIIIATISVQMLKSLVKSEPSVIWTIFFIYGMSLFGYALIFQSLFNKARTAAGVAVTSYFVLSFFDGLVRDPSVSRETKTLASLISPVAVNRIIAVLAASEQTVGLNWNNIRDEYQNYIVYDGLKMMIYSGIIFMALGLYMDNVIQQEFGTAKSYFFFLERQFWGCQPKKRAV